MTQIPESVLKKIQKLLSLAQGAQQVGSIHEAAVASEKAQAILMEYNLSIGDVESMSLKEQEAKRTISRDKVSLDELVKGKEGDWILSLYSVIAKNNLCDVLFTRSRMGRHTDIVVTIIGAEHNREIVKYFVEYLVPQIRNLSRKSFSEYVGNEKKGAYIRAFLTGCVNGIDQQLKDKLKQMIQHDHKIDALVLASNTQVSNYISHHYPQLKIKRSGSRSAAGGYENGLAAGKSMGLNKGVAGTAGNSRGLLN